MRIVMVGTGYVGLVSGACIADFGHHVTCVDTDAGKISALQAGNIPIYEPGLKEIVHSNVAQGRLSFTTALTRRAKDQPSSCFMRFCARYTLISRIDKNAI